MKEEALQQLIDAVQKASPVIWQAAYRQVRIESFEYFCGAVFLLSLCLLVFRRGPNVISGLCERPDAGDRAFIKGACYVIGTILAVATCGVSSEALERVINPTFAAIKLLKGLL